MVHIEYDEYQRVLSELIEKGKKTGFLYNDDILEKLHTFDIDPEGFEKILELFKEEKIKIIDTPIDEDDEDDAVDPKDLSVEDDLEDLDDPYLDIDIDLESHYATDDITLPSSVKINDQVRMYLKEIVKVDLLSGDDETDLARVIEYGKFET